MIKILTKCSRQHNMTRYRSITVSRAKTDNKSTRYPIKGLTIFVKENKKIKIQNYKIFPSSMSNP